MKHVLVWLAACAGACSDRALDPGARGPSSPVAPTAGPTSVTPTAATGHSAPSLDLRCLDDGTCRPDWSLQGSTPVAGTFEINFVAALGAGLFLASASNERF